MARFLSLGGMRETEWLGKEQPSGGGADESLSLMTGEGMRENGTSRAEE